MKISVLFRNWFIRNRWRLLFGICITVAVIVIWINNVNYVNQIILTNHQTEVQLRDLRAQNENLRRTINQLENPERIIGIAEQNLGMILNDEAPIIINFEENEKER
mgnify:CR=1 FL=1